LPDELLQRLHFAVRQLCRNPRRGLALVRAQQSAHIDRAPPPPLCAPQSAEHLLDELGEASPFISPLGLSTTVCAVLHEPSWAHPLIQINT
jgi:hypothetical protein